MRLLVLHIHILMITGDTTTSAYLCMLSTQSDTLFVIVHRMITYYYRDVLYSRRFIYGPIPIPESTLIKSNLDRMSFSRNQCSIHAADR